jgi:hypothetical protein
MGYLNNVSLSVEAILTNKGRELLARGRNQFDITKFSLADDEIDYRLWNPAHPLGSDYYGIAIENLPLLEAIPDETYMMKYKLVTLPKDTVKLPIIKVAATSLVFTFPGQIHTVQPVTANVTNGNANLGYTAILADSSVVTLRVAPGGMVNTGTINPSVPFVGDYPSSVSVVGTKFELVGKAQYIEDKETKLYIIGNETGGMITITITASKMTAQTNPVTND